ncbi:hypothetical protein PCAR4_830006 [Paraburkholderia caribensis]|nr:hypothetical protein PCAR4_830006 [Paraburkholderia caribensis]
MLRDAHGLPLFSSGDRVDVRGAYINSPGEEVKEFRASIRPGRLVSPAPAKSSRQQARICGYTAGHGKRLIAS